MNAQEARVEAQAKLNLLLRILGREDSGYHQIETLFCRICLADTVTVRVTPRDHSLLCHGERVPAGGLGPPEKNLAWRAAAVYAEATGFPTGFQITIEKRIPVAAGLGGGSADAGAVLRALNALNPRPVPPATLQQIASSLGADVPFLTQSATALALAWGRGERMVALPSLPRRRCVLAVAPFGVSTAEAFGLLDLRSARPAPVVTGLDAFRSWERVDRLYRNDFEALLLERLATRPNA